MSSEDQHEYDAIRALIAALDVRIVALEKIVQPLDLDAIPDDDGGDDGEFPTDGQAEVPGPMPDAPDAEPVVKRVNPLALGRGGFDALINNED